MPDDVLDMSLDMVRAVIAGYGDRMLDYQILALQSGYWSAYYSGSKHPKPMNQLAEDMVRRHQKQNKKRVSAPRPDVDVAAFLEREATFQSKLKQQGR